MKTTYHADDDILEIHINDKPVTGCGLNILCSTAARRPKLIDLLPELRPASDGLCERAQAEHDAG
ncbi:MAG: hypothetical protein K9L88_07670, partial [Chromatiaceae bacterium]|nr:hypothetical protein [Chromatiaceae bacterium]